MLRCSLLDQEYLVRKKNAWIVLTWNIVHSHKVLFYGASMVPTAFLELNSVNIVLHAKVQQELSVKHLLQCFMDESKSYGFVNVDDVNL